MTASVKGSAIRALLDQVNQKFINETGYASTLGKKDYYKELSRHINKIQDADLSYNTLYTKYHFRTLEEKSNILFPCDATILNALSVYATGKGYKFNEQLMATGEVEYHSYTPYFPNPATHYRKVDLKACSKDLLEAAEEFESLSTNYDNFYIKDESTLDSNHFNDRESIDIINQYRDFESSKFRSTFHRPVMSIIYKCKIPYSLQKYCEKFSIPPLKILLDPLEMEEHGKRLEALGCIVFLNKTGKKAAELSPEDILRETDNDTGYYVYDKKYYNEDKLHYRNLLYDELLCMNADFIFIPFGEGVIYNTLNKRRSQLLENIAECNAKGIEYTTLKNVTIIAGKRPRAQGIGSFIIEVSKKYTKVAEQIYQNLNMPASSISTLALGSFLQCLRKDQSDISFKFSSRSRYVVLNIGESKYYLDMINKIEKNKKITEEVNKKPLQEITSGNTVDEKDV